jgi:hypothetical protein
MVAVCSVSSTGRETASKQTSCLTTSPCKCNHFLSIKGKTCQVKDTRNCCSPYGTINIDFSQERLGIELFQTKKKNMYFFE